MRASSVYLRDLRQLIRVGSRLNNLNRVRLRRVLQGIQVRTKDCATGTQVDVRFLRRAINCFDGLIRITYHLILRARLGATHVAGTQGQEEGGRLGVHVLSVQDAILMRL